MIGRIIICFFCVLLVCGQSITTANSAPTTPEKIHFDVPFQSADGGLRDFAEQAGLAVIFRQKSMASFTTNTVKGDYEIRAGLARLLESTGLEGRISDNGTLVIETSPSDSVALNQSIEGKEMDKTELKKQLKKGTSSFLMSFLIATGLTAQEANAQDANASANEQNDVIVVTGRRLSSASEAVGEGEAGNTVSVTRAALLSAPSGVSGLKALEGLPGFNVQTDGALGLYEFGNSVTVRAFNFQQVGFVLDGIPMGRPDAFGGSPIFRYVDNENLGQVRASPGSGDVVLPSATSLGPVVEYLTTEPSDEFGGTMLITLGDDNLRRSFFKIETGDIEGFSGYVSRSKTDSDLWRGPGSIDREHFEAKAKYQFDDDTYISAQMVYNDFFDYDSPSFTRAQYEDPNGVAGRAGTGRNIAYLGTVPDLGVGANVQFQNGNYTGYYIDRVNVREDLLFGVTLASDITEDLDFKIVGYYEDKDGFGVSPDSYSNTNGHYLEQSGAGVPAEFGLPLVAPRGVQYGLSGVGGDRKGATLNFTYHLENHRIEVGGWFENEEYTRTQLRLNKEGGNPAGALIVPNEVSYYRKNFTSERDFMQYHLKDTISLMDDRLMLEIGFKGLYLDYKLSGFRDLDDYSRNIGTTAMPNYILGYGPQVVSQEFNDGFLPMAGAVYKITDTEQLFASYSQNFSLPRSADDLFDDIIAPDISGERSTNYEIGIRTNQPSFNAALAFYYIDFDDRIETAGREVAGQPGLIETIAYNVGSVESYGIEFTGNWKPDFFNDYAYFTANLTHNIAKFKDDIPDSSGDPLGLIGNQLRDSPKWLATVGFTVEPTEWAVANLSLRYTGHRYADFVNMQDMEGYTVVDGYVELGSGVDEMGPLKNLKIRLNVTNIFDKDTLSFTSGSVNTPASYRPLSPRTFQLTLGAEF